MATWTTPTTSRAPGFVPTAAIFKSELIDNLKFLRYQGAMMRMLQMSTNHFIDNSTDAQHGVTKYLPVSASNPGGWTTDAGFSANVGKFTIPAGMGGWWQFDVWMAVSPWSYDWTQAHKTAIGFAQRGSVTQDTVMRDYGHQLEVGRVMNRVDSYSIILNCPAGDTVQPFILQSSGVTQYATCWLHGMWLTDGSSTRPLVGDLTVPTVRNNLSASDWNNAMGWLKYLHSRPITSCFDATAQFIPSGAYTELNFTQADTIDSASMHDPVGSPQAFLAPLDGVYQCNIVHQWNNASSANGVREVLLRKYAWNPGTSSWYNQADRYYGQFNLSLGSHTPGNTFNTTHSGQGLILLRQGDYITFVAYQDSGASLPLNAKIGQVFYVGPLRKASPWGNQLQLPAGPRYPFTN